MGGEWDSNKMEVMNAAICQSIIKWLEESET